MLEPTFKFRDGGYLVTLELGQVTESIDRSTLWLDRTICGYAMMVFLPLYWVPSPLELHPGRCIS
jgi:hypothetical protein